MSHVCLARVDRIGDLILTLPCQQAWLSKRPQDRVTWLVHESLKFIMEHTVQSVEALYVRTPQGFMAQFREARSLSRRLQESAIDEVVALHVPWWVAMAFFLAKIKKRTGAASQWFSWIFFNRRLRQKRSQATKHEAQYNLELVGFALEENLDFSEMEPVQLKAFESEILRWKQMGIGERPFVVIHPGMGGSARNWPADYYHKLASKLLDGGMRVVVTGGPVDKAFVELTGLEGLQGVTSAVGKTTGPSLLALLSLSSGVVAPSTGVAHLAASLGVPVFGIYSPVKVQAPRRWAPRGPLVKIFVPQVECPGVKHCLGTRCPLYDCMPQIQVETIATCAMDKT